MAGAANRDDTLGAQGKARDGTRMITDQGWIRETINRFVQDRSRRYIYGMANHGLLWVRSRRQMHLIDRFTGRRRVVVCRGMNDAVRRGQPDPPPAPDETHVGKSNSLPADIVPETPTAFPVNLVA